MKMTFQPKKRQRSKVHGFRKRMKTADGAVPAVERFFLQEELRVERNYLHNQLQ